MALGDPFSATMQGAQQALSPDVMNQRFQEQRQKQQQDQDRQRIRQQGQQLMQQFGMINPDGTPNMEKATSLGVDIKSDGEVSIKPPQKILTPMESVLQYKSAEEAAKTQGVDATPSVNAKGQVSFKGPTPQMKETGDEATQIYEGIKNGTTSPLLTGLGRTGLAGKIIALASKDKFDLKKSQLDYIATQTLTKTMNQNQMVQLRTALNSVQMDLEPMRELNNEFERTGFTPFNKVVVGARMSGISGTPNYELNQAETKNMSQDQVQVATEFITQLNLMKDNMAVAFVRGGVPTDQAFELVNQILNPTYGQKQFSSGLDQVETNLRLRDKAVADITPYTVGSTGSQQGNVMQTPQGQAIQAGQQGGSKAQKIGRFHVEEIKANNNDSERPLSYAEKNNIKIPKSVLDQYNTYDVMDYLTKKYNMTWREAGDWAVDHNMGNLQPPNQRNYTSKSINKNDESSDSEDTRKRDDNEQQRLNMRRMVVSPK
jgi:hypothetical protein